MQGEQSGVENSAINTWYPDVESNFNNIVHYTRTMDETMLLYNVQYY